MLLRGCNVAAAVINVGLNYVYGKPKKNPDGSMAKGGVSALSETYDHVGMPAGKAFGIWGLIFLWTLVFAGYQACTSMFDEILPDFTPWFCAAQLMQGIWVPLFVSSNPEKASKGGDASLWVSNVLLVVFIPPVFLKAVECLSRLQDGTAAYWISYGITINTAWILLAAGLTVSTAARAAGLQGAALSAVAIFVLSGTFCLELYVTGLIGGNPYDSPTAFFSVGVWALFWVFQNLKDVSSEESEHGKRIMLLYGSNFVNCYKWLALLTMFTFVGLEVLVCMRKGSE